jgi:hypothetical protein
MKLIKNIMLAGVTALGISGSVFYSSCVKDQCGAMQCINHGICNNGQCRCLPGTAGANCQTIYRDAYKGFYKGQPPNDSSSVTTHALQFRYNDGDTLYKEMDMLWIDEMNQTVANVQINFQDQSLTGSTFSVVPTTSNGVTYTGNGTVTDRMATVHMIRTYASGGQDMLFFNSYIKQ